MRELSVTASLSSIHQLTPIISSCARTRTTALAIKAAPRRGSWLGVCVEIKFKEFIQKAAYASNIQPDWSLWFFKMPLMTNGNQSFWLFFCLFVCFLIVRTSMTLSFLLQRCTNFTVVWAKGKGIFLRGVVTSVQVFIFKTCTEIHRDLKKMKCCHPHVASLLYSHAELIKA